ncbi:MAG: FAD:protein FMN transferase [Gammaproteobacteria bacterium]
MHRACFYSRVLLFGMNQIQQCSWRTGGWGKLLLVAFMSCAALTACTGPQLFALSGNTMGTYWKVLIATESDVDALQIQGAIEATLERIDGSMSHWRDDSEISRLNRQSVGQWMQVSASLMEVLRLSAVISQATDGAFDITLGRLVNLWGFGPEQPLITRKLPKRKQLDQALLHAGWEKLELAPFSKNDAGSAGLVRRMDSFSVDLSAVAKGYAVDQLADLLLVMGFRHFLVDIGGELKVSGMKNRDSLWQIGIAHPAVGTGPAIAMTISLDAGAPWALATSGDYRNYVVEADRRYPHVLSQKHGRPIDHQLASVSVADASCAQADALATALLSMGAEQALIWSERAAIPVLLMQRVDAESAEQGRGAGFKVLANSYWRRQFGTPTPWLSEFGVEDLGSEQRGL